jgi:hypothetical protein
MGEDCRAVTLYMLVEPDAGVGLGDTMASKAPAVASGRRLKIRTAKFAVGAARGARLRPECRSTTAQ